MIFKNGHAIKCTEMSRRCGGCTPNESIGCYNFIKHKNDMHVPAVLKKLAIGCLVFELLKLKCRAHILFDRLLKRG